MFNNKIEDEVDFCEAYKSQILNNVTQEKSSSFDTVLKILTILILIAIIIGLSIYGYNHFINNNSEDGDIPLPPPSIQISDEDLKVIDETEEDINEEGSLPPIVEDNKSSEKSVNISDINKIANDVKLVITQDKNSSIVEKKSITQDTKEKSLEVPVPNSPESKYLEDLAKLSKEIDKE